MSISRFWFGALATGALLASVPRAEAQAVKWNRTVEASANFLFGAADGRVGALAAAAGHADSALDFRTEARFNYAEAQDANGNVSVTARSSRFSLGVDHRPFGRVSPFATGTIEASYQQRVARRLSAGGGAKFTIVPPGDNETSLSMAVLWAQTEALRPVEGVDAIETLARLSMRFHFNRKLTPTLQLRHNTLWQPAAENLGRHTTETTTGLGLAVNTALSLTLTLRDVYDSEATVRGAPSNHDGQLLFGIRAKY